MAIKVNGKWVGETPEEQFKIEKKRHLSKLKKRVYRSEVKKGQYVFK